MGLMTSNSDWEQLSLQTHELNYILQKFDKRETEKNRQVLARWEKKFKDSRGGQQTKQYTKEEFYAYAKENNVDRELE